MWTERSACPARTAAVVVFPTPGEPLRIRTWFSLDAGTPAN
jgi:hypothetical protein